MFSIEALFDSRIDSLSLFDNTLKSIRFDDESDERIIDEYIKVGKYSDEDITISIYKKCYDYQERFHTEQYYVIVVIIQFGEKTLIYRDDIGDNYSELYLCNDLSLITNFDELYGCYDLIDIDWRGSDKIGKFLFPTSTKSAKNSCC